MRLLALCSTPATLEDLGFSVGVNSLSWFVPIITLGTRVSPLHGLAIQRHFQGSWRGHACIENGRSKWNFSGFWMAHTHKQGMYPWDHILPLWPPLEWHKNLKSHVIMSCQGKKHNTWTPNKFFKNVAKPLHSTLKWLTN